MEDSRLQLLASELYTANSYIDRIFHVIMNVSGLKQLPSNRKICAKFNKEVSELLEENILHPRLVGPHISREIPAQICPEKFKQELNGITNIFNTIIMLARDPEQTIHVSVQYINMIYKFARDLHQNCKKQGNIDISYPRINVTQMTYDTSDGSPENKDEVPLFSLSTTLFEEIGKNRGVSISALDIRRAQKYEELLQRGHQAIFEKRPQKALDHFQRAKSFKETAEIFNLIGWCYSLLNEAEKAKSYCLKAIKKDPDYGPSYNDLGSYVMAEGNYQEALKWFDLAKKAPNYTNKEYPYINSGRIFVAKGKLEDALEEFQTALMIAPFQSELEKTVKELKEKMSKRKQDDHLGPQA